MSVQNTIFLKAVVTYNNDISKEIKMFDIMNLNYK